MGDQISPNRHRKFDCDTDADSEKKQVVLSRYKFSTLPDFDMNRIKGFSLILFLCSYFFPLLVLALPSWDAEICSAQEKTSSAVANRINNSILTGTI